MTLVAYLAGSDKAHKVMVGDMGLTTRADGSPGFGSIVFDDPDKTLEVRGWMKVVVHETACTDAPILFSGYVGPRRYSRSGPTGTYKHGGARWIDTTLVDENAVLGIRLITEADGKRDAETHNQRIDWLLASGYLQGLIESDALVDDSFPRPFEEADYRGQFPDNVLEDLAGPLFKTFFVYLDGATGDRVLFFDSPTATVAECDLSISNVPGEADSDTIFAPFVDADLTMDPSEVVALERYTSVTSTVIEKNAATKIEFFDDNGLGYRGRQDNNTRTGDASARERAQGILQRNSEENETLSVRLILPKDKVGLVRSGQRISGTFTHLDGWEEGKFSRITECVVTQWNGRTDLYLVQLELNSHGLSSGGGGGAPPPDDFPNPPQPGQEHEWSGTFTFNTAYGWSKGSSDPTLSDGNPNTTITSTFTDGIPLVNGIGYTVGMTISPAAGLTQGGVIAVGGPASGDHIVQVDADPDFTAHFTPDTQTAYAYASILASGVTTVEWYIDSDDWVPIPGNPPPAPGQEVPWTVVAMSPSGGVSVGTAPFPYANLSLKVKVDGVLISPASYVETDPATGDFALTWLLDGDETVTVSFQGR